MVSTIKHQHKAWRRAPLSHRSHGPYSGPVPTDDDPTRPTRPSGTALRLLVVAGTVVALEAGALIALAVAEVVSLDDARVGLGVSTAAFLGGFGLVLLLAVQRILAGHAWARGMLVFSQLICLLLSLNFRGDVWWIPTSLAGGAVLALACLLSPPVTRALSEDEAV